MVLSGRMEGRGRNRLRPFVLMWCPARSPRLATLRHDQEHSPPLRRFIVSADRRRMEAEGIVFRPLPVDLSRSGRVALDRNDIEFLRRLHLGLDR